MNKYLNTAITSLCAAALCYPNSSQGGTDKPNILCLQVDDLKPLLGCYGDKNIKTPNIDRLASMGTVLMNAHCQQAVCTASRASLMTGLRPDSLKVWHLNTRFRETRPGVQTVHECFADQGYETAGVGKIYHHEEQGIYSIPYVSVDNLKYNRETGKPLLHYHDRKIKGAMSEFTGGKSKKPAVTKFLKQQKLRMTTECLEMPDNAYQDGAIADKTIELLKTMSSSGKPFFLTVGFKKPHLPFIAPKKYWDLYNRDDIQVHPFQKFAKDAPEFAFQPGWELRSYSDIPQKGKISEAKQKELIHGYYACVSYIDAQIGKLLAKLDQLNLTNKTIIILWGDHGWHLGDHSMWCKHTNFEQATRVPFIIAAPGYRGGQKNNSPTELVDLFPTLCDLAGIKQPNHLEGVSLVPILRNPETAVKKFAVSQYHRKLNNNGEKSPLMGYSIRTERYRYTEWHKMNFKKGEKPGKVVACELYDYNKDPMEKVNVADSPEYKEVLEKMKQYIQEYFKKYGLVVNKKKNLK